jgi:hypothetical protein
MNMRWKNLSLVGLAAASIWALSACGDTGSTSAEPESTQSPIAEETTEETVNPDITPEQLAFTEGLLDEPLPQDEATQQVEEAGYAWRLGTIDGEPQAVTMDYRLDRLTLTVDDGLVTDATWG